MEHLKLTKPLAVFDLETTGLDPRNDRIVEISVLRIEPGGERVSKTKRVNPGCPIPEGASAVHGIHDEDVAMEPRFSQIAKSFAEFLGDADLAGYNVRGFDLPLLMREFERAGVPFRVEGRAIVDAMEIFKTMEPRDLRGAYRFYCGKSRDDLHSADADVQACAEILDAQIGHYADIPRDPSALEARFRADRDRIDSGAKFAWRGDEAVVNFGKHRGVPLRSIAASTPDYLKWILSGDFPADAKEIARNALAGVFPSRPAGGGPAG